MFAEAFKVDAVVFLAICAILGVVVANVYNKPPVKGAAVGLAVGILLGILWLLTMSSMFF